MTDTATPLEVLVAFLADSIAEVVIAVLAALWACWRLALETAEGRA